MFRCITTLSFQVAYILFQLLIESGKILNFFIQRFDFDIRSSQLQIHPINFLILLSSYITSQSNA